MNKKIVLSGVISLVVISGTGLYKYKEYSHYGALKDSVKIELGEEVKNQNDLYIDSNQNAIKNTVIDWSNVDTNKVGTYKVNAAYKNYTATFKAIVEDTTNPTLTLKENGIYNMIAGSSLSANDIISDVNDLSGIKSITFKEAVTDSKKENDLVGGISLSYDKEGEYSNTIIVVDQNGNTTTKNIQIHVVEDYSKHISGFQDWIVEVGSTIDFTEGVKYDERIKSVTAEKLDLTKTGTYELTYDIQGDDSTTMITEKVNVSVVDEKSAQTMANEGKTVYITGNKKKEKETTTSSTQSTTISSNKTSISSSTSSNKTSSSSKSTTSSKTSSSSKSTSSNKTSSSSKSTNNSKTSNSTGNNSYDQLTPGQHWDIGDPTDKVETNDGRTWYFYEITVQ